MFSCCCPKTKKTDNQTTETANIQQNLINQQNSPTNIKNQIRKFTKSIEEQSPRKNSFNSQRSSPYSNVQMGRQSIKNHIIQLQNSKQRQVIGVPPKFKEEKQQIYLSQIKKKSKLFQMEHNTQIMFYDMKKTKQFCLRFLILKKTAIQRQTLSSINFILSKVKSNQQKSRSFQHQIVLIISSKSLYQSKYIIIPKNIHAIFTNMKRSQQKKIGSQGTDVIEIVDGSHKHFRAGPLDRIVIMTENQKDFQFIKNYCCQITQKLSIQDYMKVWYVFPPFLSLPQINQIIKQTLRKFLVNQPIQTVSRSIFYEIDLIKQVNLEPFIIVRNRRWRYTKKHSSKQMQTQICLAVGLLLSQMSENNVVYYKELIQNTLSQTTFLEYLKLKQFLHSQKQNFVKKVTDLKILEQSAAKYVQANRKIIQQKYEQGVQYISFTIKPSTKKKFVSAFGFQQSANNSQLTPVRKQWDDNLKLQDIKVQKNSLQKEISPSEDLNIIDDIQIQNTNFQDLQLKQQSQQDDNESPQNIDDLDSDFGYK